MTMPAMRGCSVLGALIAWLFCTSAASAGAADAAGVKGTWVRLAPKTPTQPDATDLSKTLPTGHPTAVRGALAVDRTTGDVFVAACYWGLWKSTDHGETFARIDKGQIPGGCPGTQFALQINPEDGKKIFLLNTGCIGNELLPPCGLTTDGGKTWHTFGEVDRNYSKSMFLEVVAVDWKSLTVLGNGVQDGWGIYYSANAGKTWDKLARGTHRYLTGAGVFGPRVWVISDGSGPSRSIERSEDAGKTWEKASDLGGVGPVQFFKGTAYWLSAKGSIITSKDEGKTWAPLGPSAPANIVRGPYFGKDEKHIVVVSEQGFSETTDGGQTWKLLAPNPPGHRAYLRDVPNQGAWREYDTSTVAFDPVGNIFYYVPTDGYLKDIWKFER